MSFNAFKEFMVGFLFENHKTSKLCSYNFTLYNVCPVHRGMFSTSVGVQYIGGCSVHRGAFSTSGGYHEYIGGIS